MSAPGAWPRSGSYEYATASRSCGRRPAASRQNRIACSGSSHVEKATGGLPCLRRLKRSSSAAATISPSTTNAAAGSWKTALTPRTRIGEALLREALRGKREFCDHESDLSGQKPPLFRVHRVLGAFLSVRGGRGAPQPHQVAERDV